MESCSPCINPDKIACPGEGKYFIIAPLKKDNPFCISFRGRGVFCSRVYDPHMSSVLVSGEEHGKGFVLFWSVWLNDKTVRKEGPLSSILELINKGITGVISWKLQAEATVSEISPAPWVVEEWWMGGWGPTGAGL